MKNDWKWSAIFRTFALLTQIGLTMIVNIGLGFFLGYIIDYILHISLIFKILGLIIGIISGFYSVYRLIIKVTGDKNDL